MPAMRIARWRWALVPMVVVVAGCLPQPATVIPADFLLSVGARGHATFTRQPPPAGQTGQDVVAALRADNPIAMYQGRATAVFGVIDCHGFPECAPGPAGIRGAPPRTVWLVLYPECTNATGDVGWAVVDAVQGVPGGYSASEVCGR
jgi:hypothetical protein